MLKQRSIADIVHDPNKRKTLPVKILQIGEGNFLRGFIDWMIQEANSQGNFNGGIAVTNPRKSGSEKIEKLKKQKGLFTLLTKGIQKGKTIESSQIIDVFSKIIDPYREWNEFLHLANEPELKFVISNTTEAGLVYIPCDVMEDIPLETFPAKLTYFLYKRFEHYSGAPDKGLMLLPCELVEQNGQALKEIVLSHCRDWNLPHAFISWLHDHNAFLNSLVDRIVPGFPNEEAETIFKESGYEDSFLNVVEPYHLWVIQGDDRLDDQLPLKKSGLNVHWVDDLKPFQLRKIRILNGSHTLMAQLGILMGIELVREAVTHEKMAPFIKNTIEEEIVPSLELDLTESLAYGESVLERFLNPFLHHRLSDIALNASSKFRSRLLPTLKAYRIRNNRLPENIMKALAALICFYKVESIEGKYVGRDFNGKTYVVRDSEQVLEFFQAQWSRYESEGLSLHDMTKEILQNKVLWGVDLHAMTGMTEKTVELLTEMEEKR
ncbi:tagaturonate reductase [Terribacillus sp. 179-K 1B1 HS]|uniref:tagaturonate reductase n=1 Tax=Terribacillus sp. 179-K 1B1 HS TaxID=3142388 RepID=UPI00399F9A88